MRRLPVVPIALIGFWAYAVLPGSCALAQEINQPRIIGDAKLAACVNRLGQNIMHDGVAKVPFTIKVMTSVYGEATSEKEPKIIGDPGTAACINLIAQNVVRDGAARVPFVIQVTPAR
jgi:hypothetical protein